ncbi:MAG: hypothetical protein KUG68_10830 [Flavobacteriaceae bacterium]|nr:hypothetical protein [Flavobacteriaceae bacterium]
MKYIKHFSALVMLLAFMTSIGQESQNTILSKFESGKYTVYKLNSKKKFEKVKKAWPVEINKTGDQVTSILIKRAGILDELFEADVPGYPAYFAFKLFRVSFINDYAVYYEWNGKQEAKTKYILVKPGGSFSGNFETINKNVANYATATFKNQTGARANVKEQKAELAEAERKINSLEGKAVSKIEIQLVSNPSKVAHFSDAIQYGIVATLKDGSVLKTPNLGGKIPWEDFTLSHEGSSNTIDEVRMEEDASKVPNDQIVLNAAVKYQTSIKASKSISTTNDVSIRVSQNGFYGADRAKATKRATFGASQRGGDGDQLLIKVKTVKHKQTGAPLNKIEIYNETDRKLIAQYKLTPSTVLTINSNGGKGQWGSDGTSNSFPNGDNGGNGGNGGNVTIVKDPSVSTLNITVNNNGGKGGKGGKRHNINGTSGSVGSTGNNGTTNNQTKSVSLKF